MTKICTACAVEKDLVAGFYKQRLGKLGHSAQCKSCRNKQRRTNYVGNSAREAARAQAWRKANPRRHLNNTLTLKFKISVEAYEEMYKAQNGGCGICKKQNTDGRRLAVDHNHNTGTIRGLLCDRCNRGIGLLQDSADVLDAASAYLRRGVEVTSK